MATLNATHIEGLRNWNHCGDVKPNEVFHFMHSLRPFIFAESGTDFIFIDINEGLAYTFDELEREGLYFYKFEDDEDYLGVVVDGQITWIGY